MLELHFSVRHIDVQSCKHEPGQGKRYEADQEFQDRGKQYKVFNVLQRCAHEDGETTRNYNQDRHQQEHGEVVRNFTVHTSCLFYLPDAVEGDFNIGDQIENRQ